MEPFVHTVRPRYAEVDQQGVVFNAHWLTYFDDACTRFFEHLGFDPKDIFLDARGFDMMLVKATLEWSGPAAFDDVVEIAVRPDRIGTSSLDLRYTATVKGSPVCEGLITYVSVAHKEGKSRPIPDLIRERLEKARAAATA